MRAQGSSAEQVPSPSTMAAVLKLLGFRLRKEVQAKPQKKLAETDAMFANIKQKAKKQQPHPTSNA